MSVVSLLSWKELKATPLVAQPFIVKPYIPRPGITLLYGKSGVGKTPLTWELARCVGGGAMFFGLPTMPGNVLYLDVDTPQNTIRNRIESIEPAERVWFIFSNPFDLLEANPTQSAFRRAVAQLPAVPDLVILNTLRKVYTGDERDGSIPSRLYAEFLALFPEAAIVIVHHDRKSMVIRKGDTTPDARESFSGHMAWLNDCQSAIHIGLRPLEEDDRENKILRVVVLHTKNQAEEQADPLNLTLHHGWRWAGDIPDMKRRLQAALESTTPVQSKVARLEAVGKLLNLSARTVRRHLETYDLAA